MRGETTSTSRRPALWWHGPALLVSLAAVVLAIHVPQARAVILPATTIDGPSEDIVGFGGVAMAEDGGGGLVYLKRVEGVPHVFVSRYVGGSWLAPIRVDYEEPFAASWPRIGAAENGELIVVWATPFATKEGKPVYELLGALLGGGGTTFGPAMIVDQDIEEATGTSPDLAMSSTGQADVVYRVRRTVGRQRVAAAARRRGRAGARRALRRPALVEPWGDQPQPRRLDAPAHAGQRAADWRSGPPATRSSSGRSPTSKGSRASGRGASSASTVNYVLPVSATTVAGAPITDDADAPSVALSRLGQAEVAYRQPAGPGLAAAGSAHLPQHPAGWRIRQRRRSSWALASSIPRSPAGRPRWSGRRASTSTKSRICGCCMTATEPRA